MSTPFVIQPTQSDELAESLRARIQSAQLADGEFFMTEADLAKEYGVSRTVAREAVARLVAIGILEGRKRKGLVVRRPDPLHLLQLGLPSLQNSDQDVAELAMLRYVIEMGAIELAISNATRKQVEQLCQLADDFEHAISDKQDDKHMAEIDIAFHTVLLQMTGSSLVAGMQQVLVRFFQSKYFEHRLTEKTDDRMIWEHQELAAAVRDRDANRARSMLHMQSRDWLTGTKNSHNRDS